MNTQIETTKQYVNFAIMCDNLAKLMKTVPDRDAQILMNSKINEMKDYAQYGID
jgi:hypothetical protein